MKTLLVTGVGGQLAQALADLSPAFERLGFSMRRIGRPDFDFDRPETIDAGLTAAMPDLVVNAAAWTAVDAAETDRDGAARANDTGPARLAELCAHRDVPFIHVSTDYVFSGSKGAPYVETDPPDPTGVYGATKLAGEKRILAAGGRPIVLRTSWVYSAVGKNFVRTMLAAAQKTNRLRVVADQRGCPTSAADLAQAIATIVERIRSGWRPAYADVFHAAGGGETTWHGFALAIFAAASRFGRPVPEVQPITTADWPTPAKRPADSRLDCRKLNDTFGIALPPWQASLERVVAELCRDSSSP